MCCHATYENAVDSVPRGTIVENITEIAYGAMREYIRVIDHKNGRKDIRLAEWDTACEELKKK